MRIRHFLFLCSILIIGLSGIAQSNALPALERKIKVDFDNKPLADVLDSMEKLAGCRFSYNSSTIDASKLVTIHLHYKTVREVLDKIFSGTVQYKSKGEYIILTKVSGQKKIISGYVENNKGEKIAGASVYDANTMASATTNEYGYYEMKIKRTAPISLSVSKSNYADTIVPLQPATATLQNIVITEQKDTTILHALRTVRDSVASKLNAAGNWTVEQFTRNANVENISDSIHRDFQVSFVPFIGTNGRLSGNVTNDYSFNVLGGYNKGVKKAEFGGLYNISRENVSYLQFAGFSNIVGGSFKGAQFAGFDNINLKSSAGAQFGGFTNVNIQGFTGVQFGGFANYNGKKMNGASFAGFANVVSGSMKGVQSSGFASVTANDMRGLQLSGFLNIAGGNMQGMQVSGFINVAKNAKGMQLGVFNFADSLKGIPIGILSFVNHGYHKVELAYDELGYGNIAIRTGVHSFYNILVSGIHTKTENDTVNWTFGYGIGTAPKLTNKLFMNIDVTSQQMVFGNVQNKLNLLNKAYIGLEYQFIKRISLTAGVVVNGYLTETGAILAPGSESPRRFDTRQFDSNYKMESWLGWKVGIRFF